MARNKVADKARRRDVARGAATLEDEGAATAPSPGASPSAVATVRELAQQARARLAPEVLEVVSLRERGLAWTEVAERVGGSAEALRKRIERELDRVALALGFD
jgi:DNA-directed RNA polymerase specialized sigma24 family protein